MITEEQIMACKAEVAVIPDEKTEELNMPCDVYVSESERFESWANYDSDKLATGGVSVERIAQIGVRAFVLREYQSAWIIVRRTGKDAENEWKTFATVAFDLCNEMKHAFKYAFRNEPELLGRVDEIAQGTSDSDMIQDLKTYSLLGQKYEALLTPIGFDLTKLDTASSMSDEGANLLAEANGSKLKGNENKVLRDKAYTYLKEVVDEVRACGKYIFWKDKKRLVGYQSDHWKNQNAKRKQDETEDFVAD
ncbi:hypothetical protein [Ancylomarina sp. 16SWW S1-10-2]|uniref:hypothetical protein n=1 Tax=Ancylomarina sp. 16SWW S1-10-2 TaxID=2499681 RepID=UPI0012AD77EE|nr:hypothetical protein [Ancylomarina sp. 16SWW S1-10-2]MRT93126.1 hypothetical protein [Ancylomarina sp. 16SWW S1-10-2]